MPGLGEWKKILPMPTKEEEERLNMPGLVQRKKVAHV